MAATRGKTGGGMIARLFASAFPPAANDVGSHALDRRPQGSYLKGGASPFFGGIRPVLREARDEVRVVWQEAAARAVDAAHNSGWIAGGIDRSVEMTVGTGLRLNLKPDYDALGGSKETWDAWARMVERRFEAWAADPLQCDAAGKHSLAQASGHVLRSWFGTGEGLATIEWIKRSWTPSRTKFQLHPSQRLSQDNDATRRLFQGVWQDEYGLPIAYRLRKTDLFGFGLGLETIDRLARDRQGRPGVIHIFDGAAGQVRGITPLVPVLKVVRQFDQLQDATTTSSLIQAIFAATIQGAGPTEHLLKALQDEEEQGFNPTIDGFLDSREGWYDATNIDLGAFGKIAHLFPGEELKFHNAAGPNEAYETFAKFLLREACRIFGLTFEDFTGDYSGATYSSVRMATAVNWLTVVYRRIVLIARFLSPIFEAWLEEEIVFGRIDFPGGPGAFAALRPYATRCEWRGTARPQADDLKAAKALEVLQKMGIASDEWLANELGLDIQDVYEARAREAEERTRLKLTSPTDPEPDPVAEGLLENKGPAADE